MHRSICIYIYLYVHINRSEEYSFLLNGFLPFFSIWPTLRKNIEEPSKVPYAKRNTFAYDIGQSRDATTISTLKIVLRSSRGSRRDDRTRIFQEDPESSRSGRSSCTILRISTYRKRNSKNREFSSHNLTPNNKIAVRIADTFVPLSLRHYSRIYISREASRDAQKYPFYSNRAGREIVCQIRYEVFKLIYTQSSSTYTILTRPSRSLRRSLSIQGKETSLSLISTCFKPT